MGVFVLAAALADGVWMAPEEAPVADVGFERTLVLEPAPDVLRTEGSVRLVGGISSCLAWQMFTATLAAIPTRVSCNINLFIKCVKDQFLSDPRLTDRHPALVLNLRKKVPLTGNRSIGT
jgi:hypothetical protein